MPTTDVTPEVFTDEWWMYPENINMTGDFLADVMGAPGPTVRDFFQRPWEFTPVYVDAMLKKRGDELKAEFKEQFGF